MTVPEAHVLSDNVNVVGGFRIRKSVYDYAMKEAKYYQLVTINTNQRYVILHGEYGNSYRDFDLIDEAYYD